MATQRIDPFAAQLKKDQAASLVASYLRGEDEDAPESYINELVRHLTKRELLDIARYNR